MEYHAIMKTKKEKDLYELTGKIKICKTVGAIICVKK